VAPATPQLPRCRWTLLHVGQVKVRLSWPDAPGSMAVSVIGEPQAVHCGPWFCVSSMSCSPCHCSDGRTWSIQGAVVPNSIMYWSTLLHFEHSKVRRSNPGLADSMRASTTGARHLVQGCGAGSNVTSGDLDRTARLAGIRLPFC
jgi:hypothetical protein